MTPERLELPDGDFLDLAWMPDNGGDLCLVMHGLEGSLHSHYARGCIKAATNAGMHAVFMHFRGCSGEPNRLTRRYHSGDTGDIRFVIETLLQRFPKKRIHVIAVSLGGNVTLKYLGEYGRNSLLESAVTISVPFDLAVSSQCLQKGFARFYQSHLLRSLQRNFYEKCRIMKMPIPIPEKHEIDTLYDFDDVVTAPLHGFAGADDYYNRCSCRQFIPDIVTRTLILHAIDDPFMLPSVIPEEQELPDPVTLELSDHGGHVGFIQGPFPGASRYWLDDRMEKFLSR